LRRWFPVFAETITDQNGAFEAQFEVGDTVIEQFRREGHPETVDGEAFLQSLLGGWADYNWLCFILPARAAGDPDLNALGIESHACLRQKR